MVLFSSENEQQNNEQHLKIRNFCCISKIKILGHFALFHEQSRSVYISTIYFQNAFDTFLKQSFLRN